MLIVVISDVDDDDLSARQRAAYCAFSYQDRISDERRTPHSCACVVKVADYHTFGTAAADEIKCI